MFSNVNVNGTIFQAAVISMVEGGFKVVGITDANEAKEIVVRFGDNFSVTAEMPKAKAAKVAKASVAADAPTMTVNVEAKRGRGRPKGSKNAPKVEDASKAEEAIVAAEAAYFGGDDVPATPKRGRGRPRKVVATQA